MSRMSDSIFLLFWFISVRVLSGTLTLLYMTKIIIIPEDLQMPWQKHFNSHKVQIYFSLSLTVIKNLSALRWRNEKEFGKEADGNRKVKSVRQEQTRIHYFSVWPGETRIRLSQRFRPSDRRHTVINAASLGRVTEEIWGYWPQKMSFLTPRFSVNNNIKSNIIRFIFLLNVPALISNDSSVLIFQKEIK